MSKELKVGNKTVPIDIPKRARGNWYNLSA